jgi:hypothetical protein
MGSTSKLLEAKIPRLLPHLDIEGQRHRVIAHKLLAIFCFFVQGLGVLALGVMS